MGFNSNAPRQEFVASAAQTDFVFNFKIYENTDIKAYLTPNSQDADDTADILILTTDYTITIDGDNPYDIAKEIVAKFGGTYQPVSQTIKGSIY